MRPPRVHPIIKQGNLYALRIAITSVAVAVALAVLGCDSGGDTDASDTRAICEWAGEQHFLALTELPDAWRDLVEDHGNADPRLLSAATLIDKAIISRSALEPGKLNEATRLISCTCGFPATAIGRITDPKEVREAARAMNEECRR